MNAYTQAWVHEPSRNYRNLEGELIPPSYKGGYPAEEEWGIGGRATPFLQLLPEAWAPQALRPSARPPNS